MREIRPQEESGKVSSISDKLDAITTDLEIIVDKLERVFKALKSVGGSFTSLQDTVERASVVINREKTEVPEDKV